MLQSPYCKLSKSSIRNLTIVLFITVIILATVMRYLDSQIQNIDNAQGIISFELANDLSKSEAILNSWNTLSKTSAGMSMGFDFLFLIVYSLFITILIHLVNEKLWRKSKINSVGVLLIWLTFLAALFDMIENVALIKLLLGDLQQKWSSIAYYFAICKFSLLSLGVFFIIINSFFLIFKKIFLKKYSQTSN